MAPRAVELVAGIIDRLEDRSFGSVPDGGHPCRPSRSSRRPLRFPRPRAPWDVLVRAKPGGEPAVATGALPLGDRAALVSDPSAARLHDARLVPPRLRLPGPAGGSAENRGGLGRRDGIQPPSRQRGEPHGSLPEPDRALVEGAALAGAQRASLRSLDRDRGGGRAGDGLRERPPAPARLGSAAPAPTTPPAWDRSAAKSGLTCRMHHLGPVFRTQ